MQLNLIVTGTCKWTVLFYIIFFKYQWMSSHNLQGENPTYFRKKLLSIYLLVGFSLIIYIVSFISEEGFFSGEMTTTFPVLFFS